MEGNRYRQSDDDARRARAERLRERRPSQPEPTEDTEEKTSSRPILDLTGPRLRLFAKSGEFPRERPNHPTEERSESRRLDLFENLTD